MTLLASEYHKLFDLTVLANAHLSLHDYDGTMIAALMSWCAKHGAQVTLRSLTTEGRAWTCYSAHNNHINVHDSLTRTADAWSPAQVQP